MIPQLRIIYMASTRSNHHWKKYVSGSLASATNILCTYPFIKIGWRQIISDVNTSKATEKILKEGRYLIYRGVMPTLIHKSLTISMMFGIHSQAFGLYTLHSMNPIQANVAAGITTGSIQSCFMPFERVQTLLINEKFNKVYKNMFDAFLQVYKMGGIKEMYRGMTVTSIRNIGAQSSFFVCKYHFDRHAEIIQIPVLRSAAHFFQGGILSSLSYIAFYPLIALRVTTQKDVGGTFKSIPEVAKDLYQKHQLRAFYRGVHVSIFRSFLGGGIINSSYEIYMATLNKIFD